MEAWHLLHTDSTGPCRDNTSIRGRVWSKPHSRWCLSLILLSQQQPRVPGAVPCWGAAAGATRLAQGHSSLLVTDGTPALQTLDRARAPSWHTPVLLPGLDFPPNTFFLMMLSCHQLLKAASVFPQVSMFFLEMNVLPGNASLPTPGLAPLLACLCPTRLLPLASLTQDHGLTSTSWLPNSAPFSLPQYPPCALPATRASPGLSALLSLNQCLRGSSAAYLFVHWPCHSGYPESSKGESTHLHHSGSLKALDTA